jgi:hypothetical protein
MVGHRFTKAFPDHSALQHTLADGNKRPSTRGHHGVGDRKKKRTEPARGIEPRTPALRKLCSTPELSRQDSARSTPTLKHGQETARRLTTRRLTRVQRRRIVAAIAARIRSGELKTPKAVARVIEAAVRKALT